MSTFPGGKGGNQAVAAAKLGWPTLMVGQVGGVGGPASLTSPPPTPDGGARLLLASLAASAVDTRYVDVLPGTAPTGTAVIMVQEDGTGENSIVIVGGANAEEGAWLDGPGMRGALGDLGRAGPGGGGGPPVGALLLQREIPATVNVAAAGAARAAGVPVILDAGGEDAPLPPALLACVDVVSPNETELARLTGVDLCGRGGGGEAGAVIAAAVALLDASPGLAAVLVKRGAAGSVLVEAGDPVGSPPTITSQAAAPVPAVVDTTGAGDCFTAAYVVGLLRGLAPSARLRYASAAAGLCVQARGAGPSMPGHEAVMEALKGWAEEGVGA
jgi:ribokinase